jgi:transcriptional regulator with XRE-family HTH domain
MRAARLSTGSGSEEVLMTEPWDSQMQALGEYIRSKRKLANLSLRQLAERTKISNPYLSQIERGLHQPSVRVIRLISDALNVSTETLLAQAGLLHRDSSSGEAQRATPDIESAIRAEQRLSDDQKNALIAVLKSMLPAD